MGNCFSAKKSVAEEQKQEREQVQQQEVVQQGRDLPYFVYATESAASSAQAKFMVHRREGANKAQEQGMGRRRVYYK